MADSVDAAAAADGSVLVLGPSDLLFWVTFVAFVVVAVKRAWKCATSTSSSSKNAHVLVGSTEPILYKKCRFMGSLFAIDSPEDVEHALASLVASNSRVRKSTHPHMHAWVCGDRSGSHDCGESTAGRKILSVLEKSELGSNHQGQHRGGASGGYLVTVTRWYGGSHLGSARWRIIAASARAALQLLDEATPLATSSSSSSSGTTSDNPAAPGDHSHSGGTKRQRKRQRVRRKRKR